MFILEPIKLDCVFEERISKEGKPYKALHIGLSTDKGEFKTIKFLKDREISYLEYLASNTTNGKPQSVEESSDSIYNFES